MRKFKGYKAAVLIDEGFDKSSVDQVKKIFEEEGGKIFILSPRMGKVTSWDGDTWGKKLIVDTNLMYAESSFFDALFLPGGLISVEKLKRDGNAIKFITEFVSQDKPIAAIEHGPWLLSESNLLKGRKLTSALSHSTDLTHAGAQWENNGVVVDRNLITCRSLDDMILFTSAILNEFLAPGNNIGHNAGFQQ